VEELSASGPQPKGKDGEFSEGKGAKSLWARHKKRDIFGYLFFYS